MNSEKARRDIRHPFAYDLLDGEDILWASGGNPPSIRRALITYGKPAAGIMITLLIIGVMNTDRDASITASLYTAIILLIGAGLVVLYQMFRGTRMPARMYAVSNVRLFMRVDGRNYSYPIERLPDVIKFEGSQGRGTLNFGANFGNFTDIPDVNYVYDLITRLQKKQAFLSK